MTILRKCVAVFVMAATTGCYSMRPVHLVENTDASRPETIDITTRSGPELRIYGPVVRRDSLFGWYDEDRTRPASFAVGDVVTARTRQLNSGRTAALLIGGGVVVIATAYLILVAALLNSLGS